MRLIVIALAGLLLGGSAAMQARVEKVRAERAERQAMADDATCKSFGLEIGTTGYVQCRFQLREERLIERAENAQELQNSIQVMQSGLQVMQRPTVCTTVGNVTTCH